MKAAEIKAAWNQQADEFNQWCSLSLDEKLEFAQKLEREACAKLCDKQAREPECPEREKYCAEAIRARGAGGEKTFDDVMNDNYAGLI